MFVRHYAIAPCLGDADSYCSATFRLLASRVLGMVGFRSSIRISVRSGPFNTGRERASKIAARSLQSCSGFCSGTLQDALDVARTMQHAHDFHAIGQLAIED